MTKISAQVIADSKNEFGNRITTMVVTFPRIILAEFNTHRMFSRNSASSRAIPFEKMVESVEKNPFIPIAWQKDHKGMQGTEYITNKEMIVDLRSIWLNARNAAVSRAKDLSFSKATKQLCNRLLEPFMWHTVIVTATEWENFFALRCPKYETKSGFKRSWKDTHFDIEATLLERLEINKGQAEIHMMALAEAMWDAYNESTPKELKAGDRHVPFGDEIDDEAIEDMCSGGGVEEFDNFKVKIATARCARVSYTVVGEEGKEHDYEADIKLHDRLAASGHWSPFEHCAVAMKKHKHFDNVAPMSGNFRGFIQYRKTFSGENITAKI